MKRTWITAALLGTCAAITATAGSAETFNIPGGDLKSALDAYTKTTGDALIVSDDLIAGARTRGAQGTLSASEALGVILKGTGFRAQRTRSGAIGIVRSADQSSRIEINNNLQLAQAVPPRTAVETVTVTSSKLGGADVQSIPIAITALSQEQLTATQTAGGPDLVKQVPNLTFTKTNFTGYSINIRGIGTQAISVTTDPAVAVAFNDQPFIRNHFFEQEFYDVSQVQVLRGPQGTLYGRNATAGVVNLTSAKPTDQFEAMASAELGNYHQHRFEGMINIPIVDDRLDIRIAGEWTKRQGYSFNEITNERIDGRDLWSGRATIGWKPVPQLQTYLIWEHFAEDDDRIRSSKQLCKRDPGLAEVDGVAISGVGNEYGIADALSQGCLPASLYSPESFQTPNGQSLPYFLALKITGNAADIDPYASTTQSRNLRVIESTIDPSYKAKNDIVEFTADYNLSTSLTLTSQTGFNHDFLKSTQDFNRFNTAPGVFVSTGPAEPYPTPPGQLHAVLSHRGQVSDEGVFCDPQLGCSNRIVGQDLSEENAWQFNHEFRLSSNFTGPLNFSIGGNYLHYETEENYFVFVNALTLTASTNQTGVGSQPPWDPRTSDNLDCLHGYYSIDTTNPDNLFPLNCPYIDTNPLQSVNGDGHNYFVSKNPYVLNSYALFGETYYNVTDDLKLTGGLRWTDDRKHFPLIPSILLVRGWGYPVTGVVDQQWSEFTGRFAANWTPRLDFTDQTLMYASFAHGYKAGGANPPGAVLLVYDAALDVDQPAHPLTFEPEFINAFEVGTKNTLLDGALTLNANVFYYDYKNYQISQIIDRTSINLNIDARVKGAELEATWEPVPGLRFNFAGGWEDTAIAKGEKAIDLIDRTAGHTDWVVLKPTITQASNCIVPAYVVAFDPNAVFEWDPGHARGVFSACNKAYVSGLDPITNLPYVHDPAFGVNDVNNPSQTMFPISGYAGFDPSTAPNNGQGFAKDLSGNELPNAPPFTVSAGAQYSIPLSSDWAGTLRGDFYWQDNSWARIWNDNPYDRIHGYTNFNLALILTSQSGWQVMLYDKNVFNTTAITGTFLNSDDTGLTTNVFLTDPKLIGVRITKNW